MSSARLSGLPPQLATPWHLLRPSCVRFFGSFGQAKTYDGGLRDTLTGLSADQAASAKHPLDSTHSVFHFEERPDEKGRDFRHDCIARAPQQPHATGNPMSQRESASGNQGHGITS